ncbi:MAG: hypothetical protein N2444_06925 [Methylocystis sp.]|nr:hypothetical protein [Methylocystis sp.]
MAVWRFISRRQAACALSAFFCAAPVAAEEPKSYIQKDISAAKIVENGDGYEVAVTILASDFEEMFQKSFNDRRGIDLSGPGILELEIGRFVAQRIAMRDRDGKLCPNKVERAGEDPANDEAVLVSLTFACASHDAAYDASKFLAAQSARAWQVVTIHHGKAHKQVMVNAESPPVWVAQAR